MSVDREVFDRCHYMEPHRAVCPSRNAATEPARSPVTCTSRALSNQSFQQRTVIKHGVDVLGLLGFAKVDAASEGSHEEASEQHPRADVEPTQVAEFHSGGTGIGGPNVLFPQKRRQPRQ